MILIADDDNAIRLSLSMLLRKASYEVKAVATPAEVIDTVRSTAPRLVMLDMNFSRATSGDEGLTLLRQVKVFRPETPVILITAWGSIPLAVEGVRAGAFDFITKPWDNAALLQRVATALELSGGKREGEGDFDRSRIIGESPALLHVLDTVRRVAATDAPLLIMGENGTGKELIAETLHANSRRRGAPFVKVNVGGISRSLFESEMFGHRKGAFTGATADREGRFAVADKGTIFLDEIGELDANSQVKLLRVLQEHSFEMLGDSRTRHVDIRVVCATNADLPAMVADGRFREDLFYRINLITVTLPPLRERPGDIPALVRHFAAGFCRANGMEMPEIAPDAMASLRGLPYPGNIRELKNLVERTILISGKSILHAA
ncbi:MAG: sigma-54 dependent transcriptional regulator, partial [Muribaculaceae bacterium]|nr:sigma-54 dependent transcriptional regulator [Muribaculaceae bacterium]